MKIARYTHRAAPSILGPAIRTDGTLAPPRAWQVVDQRTGAVVAEHRIGGSAACERLARADAHERSMVLA